MTTKPEIVFNAHGRHVQVFRIHGHEDVEYPDFDVGIQRILDPEILAILPIFSGRSSELPDALEQIQAGIQISPEHLEKFGSILYVHSVQIQAPWLEGYSETHYGFFRDMDHFKKYVTFVRAHSVHEA